MNIHHTIRLLLGLLFGAGIQAANILLIAPPVYSHCIAFGSLGATLSKRGHRVVAYVADHKQGSSCFDDESIEKVTYKISDEEANLVRDMGTRPLTSLTHIIQGLRHATNGLCRAALRDTRGLRRINEMSFDIAVVQTIVSARCYLLIPHKYKIPYISLASSNTWFDTGDAFIPNIIPEYLLGYTNPMTFGQKVLNFGFGLFFPFLFPLVSGEREVVAEFAPYMPFVDYMWIIRNSELFIEDNDVLLSGSQPVMHNKLRVGSFTVRAPEPLPQPLSQFYQDAKHGVILVAFGSVLQELPGSVPMAFVGAFQKIKQRVLWKNATSFNKSNVMSFSWLPQNDVLGHSKTVLFISHCGRKSFFEAVYHATPIVCIPIFGDQKATADRVASLGIGVSTDYKTLTPDKLTDVISLVLREKSFKYNIERMSAFYKRTHPKTAQEMAADAVELIVDYDGSYLRPHTLDSSPLSLLMLDLWLFLSLGTTSLLGITFWLCYKCPSLIRRKCSVNTICGRKSKRE